MFVIIPATPNFIIAYIFTLIGISSLIISTLILTKKNVKIPQDIPYLSTAWTYLLISLLISIIGIAVGVFLPPILFALIHVILLAVFIIRIIILSAGKEHIDNYDAKANDKILFMRMVLADLDAITNKARVLPTPIKENTQKELQRVYEAVRYSDPMSHENMKDIESSIKECIILLNNAVGEGNFEIVLKLSTQILNQIKDRNNIGRMVK